MNELFNRVSFALTKIFQKRIIKESICEIEIIDHVDYKDINNSKPPKEGWVKYDEKAGWGGKIDSHAWFKISYDVKKYASSELRLFFCDVTSFDGSLNPQFLVYDGGNIISGMDMWHKELPLNKERGVLYVYAYTGMIPKDALFVCAKILEVDLDVEAFYFDAKNLLETSEKDNNYKKLEIIDDLNSAVDFIDFDTNDNELLKKGIKKASAYLNDKYYNEKTENQPKAYCIGHTHIDIAWLWTVKQTREKAQRSFATVINLMKKYDDYTFMSSQPFLYECIKEEAPELYLEIKKRVKEKRFIPEGCMWVEPDCNMTSGESLIRQINYGKRFFKDEFDVDSKIVWLPDTFGYTASIPQIFKKSGVDWFVSSKITWNDTNIFPYDLFLWQGIDGSLIPSYNLTAQDYHPQNIVGGTTYNSYASPNQILGAYDRFREKKITNNVLFPYGFGDGGGGPTYEQIENIRRMQKGIGNVPVCEFTNLNAYFDSLNECIKEKELPIWRGDYYLEFHRGTYTSVARIKKENRKIGFKISNVEWLGSIASTLFNKKYDYNQMDYIWKKYLQNQFHDTLSGTAIKEAYDECDLINKEINEKLDVLNHQYLSLISDALDLKKGYLVFNPNSHNANSCVKIDNNYYYINNVPAKGYKYFENLSFSNEVNVSKLAIENNNIKIKFNEDYTICEIFDKKNNKYLAKNTSLGVFQLFNDNLEYEYEAWEIKDYYQRTCQEILDVSNVSIFDQGDKKGFVVIRKHNDSVLEETIYLTPSSKLIGFDVKANWNEHKSLLKVNFPVNLNALYAECDVQFGTQKQPITRNTSWEKAKYEVCAHKFADVSQGDRGFALINDSKYGYDFLDKGIRLSLIKTSDGPYFNSDIGNHEFSFALYPHNGNYNENVMEEAYIFNNPLFGVEVNNGSSNKLDYSFINVSSNNVFVETIKPVENGFVARLYEAYNSQTNCDICFGVNVKNAYIVDLNDNIISKLDVKNNKINIEILPFEIISIKVEV